MYVASQDVSNFQFLAVSDSPMELHSLVPSPCTPPGSGWGLGIRLRAKYLDTAIQLNSECLQFL